MSAEVRINQRLPMARDRAIVIAKEIAAARKKWGKQTNPPYTLHTIMDAIVTLEAEGAFDPKEVPEGPTPEEVTKLRRQLAACRNREKARAKRDGVGDQDGPGEEDGPWAEGWETRIDSDGHNGVS